MFIEQKIEGAAEAPRAEKSAGARPGDPGFEAWGDDHYYYWSPREMSARRTERRLARFTRIAAALLVTVIAALAWWVLA